MIRTKHLELSGGRVYLHTLDGAELLDDDIELYRFKDGPGWPSELGEEPAWLEAEHDEIEDIHLDGQLFAEGCRWTANAAYAAAIGR